MDRLLQPPPPSPTVTKGPRNATVLIEQAVALWAQYNWLPSSSRRPMLMICRLSCLGTSLLGTRRGESSSRPADAAA